jgi:CheY-like chemotaxis protein
MTNFNDFMRYTKGRSVPTQAVHILLVDDDEIDIEAIQRSFAEHRIANVLTIAHDGLEAFSMLRGEHGFARLPRPYIILLDLQMPRMNGIEFLRALRQDPELKSSIEFPLNRPL